MWRIGNAVHCWWGCKSVQPCWKQHGDSPRNKKIELPYDLAILRLDIYGKEIKTGSQGDICTSVFITALLSTDKM